MCLNPPRASSRRHRGQLRPPVAGQPRRPDGSTSRPAVRGIAGVPGAHFQRILLERGSRGGAEALRRVGCNGDATGPVEVGPFEVGPFEVGPVEVGPEEAGPVEVGALAARITGQPAGVAGQDFVQVECW